jgi:hypothetical protein
MVDTPFCLKSFSRELNRQRVASRRAGFCGTDGNLSQSSARELFLSRFSSCPGFHTLLDNCTKCKMDRQAGKCIEQTHWQALDGFSTTPRVKKGLQNTATL